MARYFIHKLPSTTSNYEPPRSMTNILIDTKQWRKTIPHHQLQSTLNFFLINNSDAFTSARTDEHVPNATVTQQQNH